jgi:hypothetical protein
VVLWAVVSIKLLVEVGLLSWLAQGLIGLLAGAGRVTNPFWRLLGWVISPWTWLVRRWVAPPCPAGRVRALTGLLLGLLWLLMVSLKIAWCVHLGVAACR